MPKEQISFHQALHGYRDGHRLLASSYPLSKESERTMLALSDLSGHSIRKGFEEYITGFPLKGDGFFVLAKTWYASEMPRPGCVWTHSILIDFPTLATINNLESLYQLFTRPLEYENFDNYGIPLFSHETEFGANIIFNDEIRSLLKGLYELPSSPIIVISSSSRSYEDLIAAIWSQQWPKLRRNFTFCTGAIAPRKLGENLFDIQIVHNSSLAEVNSRNKEAVIITNAENEKLNSITSEGWINIVRDDLNSKEKTKLRKFLYEFGGEFDNGREVFCKLVKAYMVLEDTKYNDLYSVYEKIAKIFPKAKEARALKKALIEQKDRATEWLGQKWSINSIADFILSSKSLNAFQINDELIESIILQAWQNQPSLLASHLKKLEINSKLWKIAVKTLTPVIQEYELPLCHEIGKYFFKEILSQKPMYLLSSKSWEYAYDLADFFSELSAKYVQFEPEQFHNILENALIHHSNSSIKILYESDPEAYTIIFFQMLREKFDQNLLANDSLQLLMKNIPLTLKVIKLHKIDNPHILSLIYNNIPADDIESLSLYPEIWLPLVDKDKHKNTNENSLRISSVPLLIIGLMNSTSTGANLVAATFNEVHKKLLDRKLDKAEIELLGRYIELPSFSRFFWLSEKIKIENLAESLRRLLVSKFIKNNWDRDIAKKLISHESARSFFEKTLFYQKDQYALVNDALS